MKKYLSKIFCLAFISSQLLAAGAVTPKLRDKGAITRVAEINQVDHLEDHRIRVIFSAQERDNIQRFPITTIDRAMVKVEFTNTSTPPAEAKSLLLHGAGGNDLRRAMYIGFSLHRKLKADAIEELRSQVGNLLKELPSELLTVAAVSQDSARVIADVSPENGDNVNRILQQLQSLAPEGEGPALADTLCVAAERFHAWDLSPFKKSDQKILVVISNPGDSPSVERYRGQNCWRSLLDQGVRVFSVAFGQQLGKQSFDLTNIAPESGGYVHRVSGPVEMNAAVKNVIALLKSEYVIDVDAPDIALEDQPLELKVRISYHDEVFESANYNVGFVIPTLSKLFSPVQSDAEIRQNEEAKALAEAEAQYARWSRLILIAVSILGIVFGSRFIRKYLKHRHETVECNSCGERVTRDHSDCPFRRPDCAARLVVIGGALAGQTFPIMKGETTISRFSSNGIKIKGRGIRWWRHGTIMLDGHKAIYTPSKFGRDRINGWLVHEGRLLGVGSVLTVGNQKLRFEVKPQAFGH